LQIYGEDGDGSGCGCNQVNLLNYYFQIKFFCSNALLLAIFVEIGGIKTIDGGEYLKFPFISNKFDEKFSRIDPEELEISRNQAMEMFYFGYNNYLKLV
jgi:hypothetical protein